jgi:hypothetical protein
MDRIVEKKPGMIIIHTKDKVITFKTLTREGGRRHDELVEAEREKEAKNEK